MQRRKTYGTYETLIRELREEDQNDYSNYFRMNPEEFDELFTLIENDITKNDTTMREAIPAAIKLAITLRFLATGESYRSLQYQFRVHRSTISKFIPKVCDQMFLSLKEKYMNTPETQQEWEAIALEFETIWNFPNCLGALDGKHVNVQCPKNSGSYYYNYKGLHRSPRAS